MKGGERGEGKGGEGRGRGKKGRKKYLFLATWGQKVLLKVSQPFCILLVLVVLVLLVLEKQNERMTKKRITQQAFLSKTL